MKRKYVYVAEDGKEFDSEEECYEYECELKAAPFKDSLLLFDSDGRPLPINDDNINNEAIFIKCKTDDAAAYLAKEANLPNFYYRTGRYPDSWIYVNEGWQTAEEFLATAEKLKKIMNM